MPSLSIALAGNPNVGKSTLFNALTGLRQHVGNWPGKTVERRSGTLNLGHTSLDLVDLPGTYSLSAHSVEEQIARDFLIHAKPALVINVLDSLNLERNLYLTAQLLETGLRLLLVLNMIDMAHARGITVHHQRLAHELGVTVIPMSASKGLGMRELKAALGNVCAAPHAAQAALHFEVSR